MDRHVDTELAALSERLLTMGGLVERAIATAVDGLLLSEPKTVARVHEIEQRINQSHMEVDDACVKVLALQQPVATDLRFVVASIKINTDLERMGDQAVNVAHNAERFLAHSPVEGLDVIQAMSLEVRAMVRDALDSFVQRNITLATSVLMRDDIVDGMKNQVFRTIADRMRQTPSLVDQGLDLILIARNLEKIGDHASNIAEDVIFVVSGQDIRHPGERTKPARARTP